MGKKLRSGFYWRGGVVWVRTDPLDKVPRSTDSRDPEAAYLWRAERERIKASPSYAASLAASFGHWVVKMIDLKTRERSEGTVHMYTVKLGHFVRIWGEDMALASIDSTRIDDYIEQRRTEGVVNNTIARELTCLRQLLRHAKRAKQFPTDITEIMPIGFERGYVPRKRTLRAADFPKLWAALQNDEERAWVAMALSTAADSGDVERALPTDYDPVRRVMRVRGTKTDTRDDEVPILPHVRELFEYALARLPVSWPRADKGVGEACRRAGIPHLSPKDLRRTAATWLVKTGTNQSLVSRFLRHGSDAMVRQVYGQVTAEELGTLIEGQTRAETLQVDRGPLGETGKRGGLKRRSGGAPGDGCVEVSQGCEPASKRSAPSGSAETLQRAERGVFRAKARLGLARHVSVEEYRRRSREWFAGRAA